MLTYDYEASRETTQLPAMPDSTTDIVGEALATKKFLHDAVLDGDTVIMVSPETDEE